MPGTEQHAMPTPDQELSAVLENYLEIIFRLELRDGAARASAIAKAANVSRPTVTSALKTLQAQGFVDYAPYSLIRLTDKGLSIGRDIAHRHMVFEEFFRHVLKCENSVADTVACELEHVVPPEVIQRMGQFVLFLKNRTAFWQDWQQDYERENMAANHMHPQSPASRNRADTAEETPYK